MTSIAVVLAVAGCAADGSMPTMGHREMGTIIGAAGGAVIGAVAYDKNRTKGALIGAVGGALAGGAVGRYMDDQKRDLEKNLANEIKTGVAKVEKLPNDVVRVTMTNQTAFDFNSTEIKSGFYSTMDKLADVVVRYNKTALTVVGHTDNVGSDSYNQKLSEQRALSVARYLEGKRVHSMRLATSGKGESQPLASNNSESGRQANRRVEIYVEPVTQS
ncbi:MAG TPA: OmpA family protein [Burkholderiales bacterium]|jgi:outer membrane protein OmpA-like peptidoglycan-associated protein|nr:OmpA family protein [Burkholderiales bacterium]